MTQIASLEDHVSAVKEVSFSSPGGSILVSGSGDGTAILWDLLTGEKTDTFGHTDPILSVSLSGGATLVAGGRDGKVLMWDVSEWTEPRPWDIEIISGDGQQGSPGGVLAQPLVVAVRDQYGDLLPGATVTFMVTVGEGKLSGRFAVEHATTDASGRAELPLTLGLHTGPNSVGVSIDGRELAVFHAEGVGTTVAELEGDHRTWYLPQWTTARLGKGVLGIGDRAVSLSADGQCLAVASAVGVWLYEASTSRVLALMPTEDAVHSVSFSLDGTLAAGLDNGRVELWEVENGERVFTFTHTDRAPVAVVFSWDGATLATGSTDYTNSANQVIKVWDIATQLLVGTWEVPGEKLIHRLPPMAFSPDGTRLVCGFEDGTIRIWDVASQAEVFTLEGHTDRVTSVSFSPDGSLLASAGWWDDPTVRLWDATTRTELGTLRGHRGGVRSVAFSNPDGSTLASSGQEDHTVRLWDVATRRPITTLKEHTGPVHSVTFSRDGSTLISGSADGRVLLRNLESGNAAGLSGHESLSALAFSRNGAFMASGSGTGSIKLWDAVTKTQIAVLDGHTDRIQKMAFSPDGSLLASAGRWDPVVKLWDVGTRELAGTLRNIGKVSSVAFSPDGATLASGGGWNDAKVRLWDTSTRQLIGTLEGHLGAVSSVSFSPDGTILASGGGWDDNSVILWDVGNQELIGTLEGHDYGVGTVAFSPDGKTLASGSDGVRVWDVTTRTRIATLLGREPVYAVAFSPDGKILVSGVRETVNLREVGTWETSTPLGGHTDVVHSVAFSRDGTLASGSSDGTVLLWNLRPQPQSMTKATIGHRHRGVVGTVLALPLVVRVLDQYGDPLAGVTATFTITAGGGTLSTTTATTDADGRASTTLTFGPQPGTNTVEATVGGLESLIFTAIGQTTATTLDKLSGDQQQGLAGIPLVEPLVVEVRDQTGATYAAAKVIFTITAGGGTLSTTTATTDADGRASTTLTLGREPGTNIVRASISGLQPVTFTATAKATPDFDGNGVTDVSDFFLFVEAFGGSDPRFDLDASGSVDFADFFLFAEHFGQPARAKLVALARERIGLPDGPGLQQNAPNPFNSQTVIPWFVLQSGPARLEVFALTGQRVAVLHQGPQKAGLYRLRWDGRDDQGRPLASGVYVYRLVTAEAVQTRKLTLLR